MFFSLGMVVCDDKLETEKTCVYFVETGNLIIW